MGAAVMIHLAWDEQLGRPAAARGAAVPRHLTADFYFDVRASRTLLSKDPLHPPRVPRHEPVANLHLSERYGIQTANGVTTLDFMLTGDWHDTDFSPDLDMHAFIEMGLAAPGIWVRAGTEIDVVFVGATLEDMVKDGELNPIPHWVWLKKTDSGLTLAAANVRVRERI
jgi:hypothetical protein